MPRRRSPQGEQGSVLVLMLVLMIPLTALGIAIKDGKLDLQAPARRYHPTLGVPPESNADRMSGKVT